jgi:hypothetical protein
MEHPIVINNFGEIYNKQNSLQMLPSMVREFDMIINLTKDMMYQVFKQSKIKQK